MDVQPILPRLKNRSGPSIVKDHCRFDSIIADAMPRPGQKPFLCPPPTPEQIAEARRRKGNPVLTR